MAGSLLRRWVIPAGLIVLAGIAGAFAIGLFHAASSTIPLPGPGGTGTAPAPAPAPPPGPEKEATFVAVFGGELGARIWAPPCSRFGLGGVDRVAGIASGGATRTPAALSLDLGDLVQGTGEVGQMELEGGLDALDALGFHAAAVGEADLLVGLDRWRAAKNRRGRRTTLLCANLRDDAGDPLVPGAAEYRIGKRRVLVTAILSPSYEEGLRAAGVPVRLIPPAEAVRGTLKVSGAADLVILLSNAPPDESRALAKELPEVRFTATAHAGEHPWLEPESVGGRTIMAPGPGWQYFDAALFGRGEGEGVELLETRVLSVGKAVPPQPMAAMVAGTFLMKLLEAGALQRVLEADAAAAPEGAPAYAGPAACASCHTAAHEKWSAAGDPHAAAGMALKRGNFAWVPYCLSCHGTGVGRPGGMAKPWDDQATVTCEACHGPGRAHAEQEGRVRLADAKSSCGACHTPEMSPAFKYEEAWPKILHGK